MRTQSAVSQNAKKAGPEMLALAEGMAVVFQDKVTEAERKSAVKYLLNNMPEAAKPGAKTAQQVLHEIREGGK